MIKYVSFSLFLISTTSWSMNQITPKVQAVRNDISFEKYLLTQWRPLENKNIGLHEKDINRIIELVKPHYAEERRQYAEKRRWMAMGTRGQMYDAYYRSCPKLFYCTIGSVLLWQLSWSTDLPDIAKQSFLILSVLLPAIGITAGLWIDKNIPESKNWRENYW